MTGSGVGSRKPILISLFLLGSLLYAHTADFGYVLDDRTVITDNAFTKKGIAGIPDLVSTGFFVGVLGEDRNLVPGNRYRPLSTVMFAIEYEIVGESPWLGHVVNALLYGLTGVVLFLVLNLLLPAKSEHALWNIPFLATLLFLVHPLHTEVVANIKGRDEILSLLGALGATALTVRFLDGGRIRDAVWAGVVFTLGLFAKETAVTFVVVIPLACLFFRSRPISAIVRASIPLVLASAAYLAARFAVVGWAQTPVVPELMNNPFLGATHAERMATTFYTMLVYLKLLVFPHPLTHDYYPYHITLRDWSDPRAVVSVFLYAGMVVGAIWGMRRRHPLSFAAFVFLITFLPVSNLLLNVGTFMNERFMYAPSVGFALAVAYVLVAWTPEGRGAKPLAGWPRILFAGVLVVFAALSVSRSMAWRSGDTLSLTDVKTSPESAHGNLAAGMAYLNRATATEDPDQARPLLEKAIAHLKKSLRIHPSYVPPMDVLGTTYFEAGLLDSSYAAFNRCLQAGGADALTSACLGNMGALGDKCAANGRPDLAVKCYRTVLSYRESAGVHAKLGRVYGKDLGDLTLAFQHLNRARELEPENPAILRDLGVAYGVAGDDEAALDVFEQALKLDPENPELLRNAAVSHERLGNADKAAEYRRRAEAADEAAEP